MTRTIPIRDGGILLCDQEFLPPDVSNGYFVALRRDVPWKQEISFGRRFPRLTAWYADEGIPYTYSGVTHQALGWPPLLMEIREKVQAAARAEFNSVLLNLYRDGADSVGYHTDAGPEVGENPVIGSLSLGAARRFHLRHTESKERLTFELGHGSLLVMGGTTQDHWLHAVPKTKEAVGERINLTFRKTMVVPHA